MEFYAGDPYAITKPVDHLGYDRLDDPLVAGAKADFSLHLIPDDLNFLSRAIAETTRQRPMGLRPIMQIVIDKPDYGVLAVDPGWVAYVARAEVQQAAVIADAWAKSLNLARADDLVANTHVLKAIEDLIVLCQQAHRSRKAVVHVWYA